MQATELQIGDYILYNGTPIKVCSITKRKTGYHTEPNESRMHYERVQKCEPIPLTPEILERNGFKKPDNGYLLCLEEGIETQNYVYVQFRLNGEVRYVEIDTLLNKAQLHNVLYVHQLQQALRLCRITKEIQL